MSDLNGKKPTASTSSPRLTSTLALLESMDADIRKRPPEPEFPTGIPLLDEVTFGLHRGEMVVMASRPGGGKTTMALHMAYSMAKAGKRGIFFSIEMTPEALLERLFCLACEVNGWDLRTGKPPSDYDEKLKDFKSVLSSLPLHIIEWGYEIGQISGLLKEYGRNNQMPDFIIIDHLMMVETDMEIDRRNGLNAYLLELRRFVKKQNIACLVISQLNRGADSKRPSMANLKETGLSEEVSETVWLLWWKGREEGAEAGPEYHIIVDKQRHGPVGECIIEFHPKTFSFVSSKHIPAYSEESRRDLA